MNEIAIPQAAARPPLPTLDDPDQRPTLPPPPPTPYDVRVLFDTADAAGWPRGR